MFNKKGQTSLELLVVTLFVLIAAIAIISNYLVSEKNMALVSVVKQATLKELADIDSFYYIQKIEGPVYQGNNIVFRISIGPQGSFASNPSDFANLANNVSKKVNDANIAQKLVQIELQ